MSMERSEDARQAGAAPAESSAWLAHLMARYDCVVVPKAADCDEERVAPPDYAAVDAIMRYYNG